MTYNSEIFTVWNVYREDIEEWLGPYGDDAIVFSGRPFIDLINRSFVYIKSEDLRLMFKLAWGHAIDPKSIKISSVSIPYAQPQSTA